VPRLTVKKLVDSLVDYRRWYFIVSMIIIATICSGVPTVVFDPALKSVFSDRREAVSDLNYIHDRYQNSDNIVFLVHMKAAPVTDKTSVELLDKITTDAKALPFSYRINSLTNHLVIESLEDELQSGFLVEKGEVTEETLAKVKSAVVTDPLVKNRLVNANNDTAVVYVTFNLPKDDRLNALQTISNSARELRAKYEDTAGKVEIYLAGTVYTENAMLETSGSDAVNIIPLMLLLAMIINLALLRSVGAYLVMFTIIILSVITTAGIVGFLGWKITTSASMGFLLVIILATADSIHVSFNYIKDIRAGFSKVEALKNSIMGNIKPMFLTSLTTIIGLATLNLGDAPTFAMMGNIASIGVVIAFLLTMCVFPFMIALFKATQKRVELPNTTFTMKCVEFSLKNSMKVLTVTAGVVAVTMYFMLQNTFNEDQTTYFDRSTDVRRTAEFAKDNMPGARRLFVTVETSEEGIYEPAYLDSLQRLTHWLRQRSDVDYVFSYLDVLDKINVEMGGDKTDFPPRNRELSAQYTLLYELSLPYGMDTHDLYTLKRDGLLVEIGIQEKNNKELLAFNEEVHMWMRENTTFDAVKSSSYDLVFADYGQSTLSRVLLSDLSSVIFIMFFMMVGLGSIKYGGLSLIPNLIPPIIVYGIWGWVDGEITIAAGMTFSVVLGIIVDDTTYLISKFLKQRKVGVSTEGSIYYAFSNSGPALIATTLVFAGGSSLLCVSNFIPNATIGFVMAPMVITAIIFDYLTLPALLNVAGTLAERRQSVAL